MFIPGNRIRAIFVSAACWKARYYVINDTEITDPVLFEEYEKLSPATVALCGGRFLARGGRIEGLEGS